MTRTTWRFRDFELDRDSFLLRRLGVAVKLDPKPLELLFLLAERNGAVVSHEEALTRVWGEAVFVDGESAIYTAIKKIRRALEDPDLVQTVSGRGYRLRMDAPAAQQGLERAERLAILPLANLSGDPAQDYFSDGLTEELIATMARLFRGRLEIISRTSVMRFKGVSRSIEEIAQELRVQYLIEGSVRRQSAKVRIAVQLIRARDGSCLWTETFERGTDDVFSMQTEIALASAGAIKAKLTSADDRPASADVDMETYDLYLRGRHLWVQRTRPTIEAAIRYFREVLDRNKKFAPAYSGLSCCYAILPITTNQRPAECFPQAQVLATTALELDATQVEAHIALGLAEFWYHRNWDAARDYFQRAAALNPSESSAPMFLAHIQSVLCRHTEALLTLRKAQQLDPLSPIVGTHVGHFLYNYGLFEEALEPLEKVLELQPQFWVAHLMRGKALASLGRTDAALDALEKAHRLGVGNTEALSFRIYTLAASHRKQEAQDSMKELERMHAVQPVSPVHRALAHLGLGDRNTALELIEESFAEHDVRLIFLAVEKRWQALGENNYKAALSRVGFKRS